MGATGEKEGLRETYLVVFVLQSFHQKTDSFLPFLPFFFFDFFVLFCFLFVMAYMN